MSENAKGTPRIPLQVFVARGKRKEHGQYLRSVSPSSVISEKKEESLYSSGQQATLESSTCDLRHARCVFELLCVKRRIGPKAVKIERLAGTKILCHIQGKPIVQCLATRANCMVSKFCVGNFWKCRASFMQWCSTSSNLPTKFENHKLQTSFRALKILATSTCTQACAFRHFQR